MSSLVLIKKEIYENKWVFIIGLLLLLATALSTPFLYNMLKNALSATQNIDLPGFAKDQLSLITNFESYVWYSWFGKAYIQTGSILAILLGMGIVAGEVSKDTITFILTKPFSRNQVFISKYITGAILLFFLVLVPSIALYIAILINGQEFLFARIFLGIINSFGGLLVIYSIAALFSTLINESIKAGLITGVIAVLLSIPGFFSDFSKYSIYKYITGGVIFRGEGFPWQSFSILIIIAGLLFLIGLKVFQRKQF